STGVEGEVFWGLLGSRARVLVFLLEVDLMEGFTESSSPSRVMVEVVCWAGFSCYWSFQHSKTCIKFTSAPLSHNTCTGLPFMTRLM
ncbi:hypothetical protein HMI55_001771, partial [Coelomomyces lativittatus]